MSTNPFEKTTSQIQTQKIIIKDGVQDKRYKMYRANSGLINGKSSQNGEKNKLFLNMNGIGIGSAKEEYKKLNMNWMREQSRASSRIGERARRNSQVNQELNGFVRNLQNESEKFNNNNGLDYLVKDYLVKKQSLQSEQIFKFLLQSQVKSDVGHGYYKNKLIKVKLTKQKNTAFNSKQVSLWLGQVYDRCTSSAFQHFTARDLDYTQTKSYCCEQIISNILEYIRETKDNREQVQNLDTSQNNLNKMAYKTQPMKFINEESNKILGYLCSKYPQTNITGANKQVSEIVESIKIDNWQSDQYDLLRLSPVKFTYKEHGDYSSEIMLFLNFLMDLPFKPHKSRPSLTNFQFFQKFMQKIFNIVYFKDTNDDLSSLLKKNKQLNLDTQNHQLTFEQEEYMEKVKKYTSFQIGSKISGTAKHFSKQDILSGIIKVDDNAVSRVIDKWVQELGAKFYEAEKSILNRVHRFKSEDSTKFNKLSKQSINQLFKIVSEKRRSLQEFINQLKQSLYDLSGNLGSTADFDLRQFHFIDERQRIVGEFAIKMSQSSSEYFIQILQKQIGLLIQSIQELKQNWVARYRFKQSPLYQSLKINLITFKIGDLLRCKIVSNEAEITRVLKLFIALSQMWDTTNRYIKIIRVKNRLESGTRDILINFMFDQICPCQIQLCVAEKIEEKQAFFDKFNHFLYELKRAYLGPIMEMCKIWKQYDGRSDNLAKLIEKQTKKKIGKKKITEQFTNFDVKNQSVLFEYKFPFICSSCNIFYPRAVNIYFTTRIHRKFYCGNCWAVKASLQVETLSETKKMHIFRKYISRYPNFIKIVNNCSELTSLDELLDSSFQINIPIHSKIIHMEISMSLRLNRPNENIEQTKYNQYAFVSTKITNESKLIKQICIGKYEVKDINNTTKSTRSVQPANNSFDQNYIFYGWKMPTKLIPLPSKRDDHYFEMIQKLMPSLKKIQQVNGETNLKVCAIQVQKNKYYFLPFFAIDEQNLADQVVHQVNLQKIMGVLQLRNEVLEMESKNITRQFEDLPLNIKLRMAYTIKEIYLNSNKIGKVEFIQNLYSLQVFQANNNLIDELPKIPRSLQQLALTHNKIASINQFIEVGDSKNYHLKLLNLSYNQITHIQNICNIQSLKILYIIRCKISKIEGLPASLTNLALSFNQIPKIEGLNHLQNLAKLNLAGNQIETIENLQSCRLLQILMLSRNNIKLIQNLQSLQNLAVLHISFTGLVSRHEDCGFYKGLKGLRKLKRMLIEGNRIQCFMQMIGLQKADFDNNNVENLSYIEMEEVSVEQNLIYYIVGIQKLVPYLKILNIKKNKVKEIESVLNLSFLEEFDGSQNLIEVLPQKGWEKLSRIKNINLSHNKIRRIPNIAPLLFIKSLNLECNLIECVVNFPSWPFGQPDFTRYINLKSNTLFCDQTSSNSFQFTLCAIGLLTTESKVNLLGNGNCQEKLQKVKQIGEFYNLKLTIGSDVLVE